jgi:hypothetical protein
MRALAHLRTSFIAIATILAMLVVPACGSLCTAMTHCPTSAVSASSETCHHADMSVQSDSETSFSSQISCGQQTPLFAILTSVESSLEIASGDTAVSNLSAEIQAHAVTLARCLHDSSFQKQSPPRSIPLENFSVLRV